MAHHYSNPLLDSLYCLENHFEEEQEEEEKHTKTSTTTPFTLLEQDMFCNDEELKSLLSREQSNQICMSIKGNSVLESARREAVDWILRVNVRFSFSAVTAVLALDYLDRFLCSFTLQNWKPWLTQLISVTCLSLAAKVEETHVPHYVDLQVVEENRYLFEAKTIKRMEILVLTTLGWKMNPVTPLTFLDYITRRLGLKDFLCIEFLRRCETILLSVFADTRFMSYLPSVLATATMMHVVNIVEPRLGIEYQNQLLAILGTNKDKVKECYKLMLEKVLGYDDEIRGNIQLSNFFNKRKFGSIKFPNCSPNGVMDGSFNSDCSHDSWDLGASSPQPLFKKPKTQTQDQLLLNHSSNSDILTIPR